MYKQFLSRGWALVFGTGATGWPGFVFLGKACRNGIRFHIGGTFIVVCWPLPPSEQAEIRQILARRSVA